MQSFVYSTCVRNEVEHPIVKNPGIVTYPPPII